jgi:hypothetical protein
MNVPGDIRHPSTKKVDKANAADGGGDKPDAKAPAKAGGKTTPAKAGGKTTPAKAGGARPTGGGGKPAGGGGKGPRKPLAPVRVSQGRNWGPIAMYGLAGLLAVAIIGFGAWQVIKQSEDFRPLEERVADIVSEGVVDYNKTEAELLKGGGHQWGPITYKFSPPFGGQHNANWQRCQGDVYSAQVATEHAVHSMEHGAVWITYRPDLPQEQIDTLKSKVEGREHMLMSPFPGQESPISLQSWGYQLKVDNAGDARIDKFIKVFRANVGPEAGATCSTGSFIDSTGTVPKDLGKPADGAPTPAAAP